MDGRDLGRDALACYSDQAARRYLGRSMTLGEIGCHMSHSRALETFLATGEELGLVFEDDIDFGPGCGAGLHLLLGFLREQTDLNWHAINIGARKRKFTTPLAHVGSHELVRAHYYPILAHGVIWSRAGATAYLEAAKTIFCPADIMMRHVHIRSGLGLALYPPIVTAETFASDIGARSTPRRSDHRRRPFYALHNQRRLWNDRLIAARKMWGTTSQKTTANPIIATTTKRVQTGE